MRINEDICRNKQGDLAPLPAKPKEYPPEYQISHWVVLLAVVGMSLFSAFKNFSLVETAVWLILISPILYFYLGMRKRERQACFLESYQFPQSITRALKEHYPHLSDEHLILVMQGLRQYFQLANLAASQRISMPSRVVDVAWHEFILLTQRYAQFCEKGLGRFLHHIPVEEQAPESISDETKAAWLLACNWEGINQKSPNRLPFLFGIDAVLQIPEGFTHSLVNKYASDTEGFGGGGGCASGCGGGC